MAATDAREKELIAKQICRFCLTQAAAKLSNICDKNVANTNAVPLHVQVMSIASIEVFSNDGMPAWVCSECRLLFDHCYRFKKMCKRAETLLRQYPLTGQWPAQLSKPKIPEELLPKQTLKSQITQTITSSTQPGISNVTINTASGPKKLLNSNPVAMPEPPIPLRLKKEKLAEETNIFLHKVENEEELSMDDIMRLTAATTNVEEEYLSATSVQSLPALSTEPKRPKLLNKQSIRILNTEAEVEVEPRLSKPQVKRDEDGNVAIVTQILDPGIPYETEADPVKSATPIETNIFPCPHCERSFPLLQLREIHMVNHNRERFFQCPECDKSFFSKYDLQKHWLIHTGDKPFQCSVCDKAFTRASLLHRHERTHTDIPKFICIYCEKPFISKEEMEKHTERHRKNRPFVCKVCNKAFAFKQGLERHEMVHSRHQPYPCQYCEQSFSTPSKLARHLTAHAGKRPYPCKFCSKQYLLSHHLTRHLRSHKQGTAEFQCSECRKVFRTRDELIYHSAVHATQTLVCPLCGEKLSDVEKVPEHIKQHADGDTYACEFCDLIFMTAERLQKHVDNYHVDEMLPYREESKTLEVKRPTGGMDDLQQTIDEFLIDELEDDVKMVREEVEQPATEPQAEPSQTVVKVEKAPKKPKIISQVVLNRKKNSALSSPDKNLLLLDDDIIVTNEALDSGDDDDINLEEVKKAVAAKGLKAPPPKQPRLNNQQSTAAKTIENSGQISMLRRKIAGNEVINIEETNPEIKIENGEANAGGTREPPLLKQQNIDTMLKSLPKGVSVRRNMASTIPKETTISSTTMTRAAVKRASDEGLNKATTAAATPRSKIVIKRSLADDTAVTTIEGASDDSLKFSKIMGQRKMKMQKIKITRAEADAMAKEGRIRIQDGTMFLTTQNTKKVKQ